MLTDHSTLSMAKSKVRKDSYSALSKFCADLTTLT